jgi:hypothetical protein
MARQGYRAALQGERMSHELTVERIRQAHKLGLAVARRVARGEQPYPGLPRGAVRRALEELRDMATVESAARGHWRFTDPLLRRYLVERSDPYAESGA